jgi:hypothetical protein
MSMLRRFRGRRLVVVAIAVLVCGLGVGAALAIGGVPAARWSTAVVVSTGFASEVQVGLDHAGDEVAAWNRSGATSGTGVVVATRALGAAGWSVPVQLNAEPFGTTYDPQLQVARSGAAVVVWQAPLLNAPGESISAVFRTSAGGSWSAPSAVARGFLDGPHQLGTDADGNATLIYDDALNRSTVDAVTLDAGTGTWSSPVAIGRSSTEVADPQIAVDGHGDAVAVWSTQRLKPSGSAMTADRFDSWVEAAARTAGGAWQRPVRLGPETQLFYDVDFEASPSGPQVALDARGDAIAIWQQSAGGNKLAAVGASLSRGAHRWQPLAPLDSREAISPRVAVSTSGWATVAWENRTSGVSTRSGPVSGSRWSPVITFPGSSRSMDYHLQLVAGAGHGAALGYSRSDASVALAIHRLSWGKAVSLGLGPAGHRRVTPDLASLAATSTGQLLAGWTQDFPPPHGGYATAKIYASSASPNWTQSQH